MQKRLATCTFAVLLCVGFLLLPARSMAASVTLQWDYEQGGTPAVSFAIYKRVGCDGDVQRFNVPVPTQTFVDTATVVNILYCYTVTAIDVDGNESAASNILMVRCKKARKNQVVCATQ